LSGLSGMNRKVPVPFLGGWGAAMPSGYPTQHRSSHLPALPRIAFKHPVMENQAGTDRWSSTIRTPWTVFFSMAITRPRCAQILAKTDFRTARELRRIGPPFRGIYQITPVPATKLRCEERYLREKQPPAVAT
jgi:hypothetical protein